MVNILLGSLLNLIALSLSGYRPSESALWMQTCIDIRSQISHPYLRALFTFLCSGGDFKPILVRIHCLLDNAMIMSVLHYIATIFDYTMGPNFSNFFCNGNSRHFFGEYNTINLRVI